MQYILNENATKGADTRLMKKKFFDAIDVSMNSNVNWKNTFFRKSGPSIELSPV